MTESERLVLLKSNIDRPNYSNDAFLKKLMEQAEAEAVQNGIDMSDKDDIKVNMLIIDWAAYLFRKRDGVNAGMPEFLRKERNDLLFAQKGRLQ